jgi:hypothetical protein
MITTPLEDFKNLSTRRRSTCVPASQPSGGLPDPWCQRDRQWADLATRWPIINSLFSESQLIIENLFDCRVWLR